jgi:hypothetical protein
MGNVELSKKERKSKKLYTIIYIFDKKLIFI